MKILTLCGSMKFTGEMIKIAFNLETQYGFNILQPVFGEKNFTDDEISNIVKSHYKKIDISDGIYVVDINGYIGNSVKAEIEYAKKHNKEIIYHSDFYKASLI